MSGSEANTTTAIRYWTISNPPGTGVFEQVAPDHVDGGDGHHGEQQNVAMMTFKPWSKTRQPAARTSSRSPLRRRLRGRLFCCCLLGLGQVEVQRLASVDAEGLGRRDPFIDKRLQAFFSSALNAGVAGTTMPPSARYFFLMSSLCSSIPAERRASASPGQFHDRGLILRRNLRPFGVAEMKTEKFGENTAPSTSVTAPRYCSTLKAFEVAVFDAAEGIDHALGYDLVHSHRWARNDGSTGAAYSAARSCPAATRPSCP